MSKDDLSDDKESKDDGDPRANLIVNYLPASVGESELRTLFERFGGIKGVKVIRDKFTAASLGYGFVKFDNPESAINAVSSLNGYAVEDKKIKVSIARPASKEITRSNLYISGIPATWSEAELSELLSPYGKVIECRVLTDPQTKQPRGVGFCRLDTHENAQAAITALNGSTPLGATSKLSVKLADPPKDYRRLGRGYAGYGPASYRYNPLGRGFAGTQVNLYQGYGVPYSSPSPYQFSGGTKTATTKQSYPGVCLFIYHLTPDCNESTLQQLFSNYGTVLSAKVMKDLQTGRNKGFGFVNMMNDQQAQLAISSLSGYRMGDKYLKVSYKK